MDECTQSIMDECKRQEESCLYTSTTIYEWLKYLRVWRNIFVVIPLVLGGVAAYPLPKDYEWIGSVCALLAGIIPAVYKALDFDQNLKSLAQNANEFKILQDRFRQAHLITAKSELQVFNLEFKLLMQRMDSARVNSPILPERFFKKAQKKINKGHYEFKADT